MNIEPCNVNRNSLRGKKIVMPKKENQQKKTKKDYNNHH